MYSQEINQNSSKVIPSIKNDSLQPILKDSLLPAVSDSLTLKSKDSIVKPKETLEGIIEHTADSLIKQDIKNNKIILYYNAHVHYKQTDLKAGYIEIDNNTNVVTAKGIKDSIGDYTQLPVFTEGADSTTQDSLRFNFKTEKAKIWGLETEQEGIKIKGSITKKENDSTVYVRDIIFTTSEKDKPDYYIKTKKAKIVPDKKIVIGFSNLVIQEVPTPLFLPFAYVPLTKGSTSGFLMPTWGQNNRQGFFLQNGGYYFALSDYFDLAVLADIYTNGSWGARTESNYALRYKFSGNFNFRFESLINGQRGFDDYSKTNNYNIRWSHSQDSKSSPNARFSASVNLGSSKYYRQSLNEFDNNSYLNNTLSSSVNYYKKLVGTPFNFSASITHSQNTNTEVINMSLPSFLLNMDRIYPFASKSGSKKNALQRTGLTYALKSDVKVSTTDEFFFKQKMFEDMKTGMQQNASLSTNLKLLKYFTVSPSLNYKEVWYFDKLQKTYDENEDTIVVDTINGFNTFREFSTGASLGTKVYGMLNFKKGNIKAIRHVMTPSISYNYRPDMANYYEEVQQSEDPTDLLEYSPFANGIYGSPGRGVSNGLSMSINNTLEAKAKSKDSLESDDPTKDRIITLLNNLSLSTSYNIALDSLKWSPISMNAGTFLFDKKMQVNLSASMDPYALNLNGQRINESNISQGGSLLRLTNASFTANYSLSSKKDTKQTNKQEQNKIDNNSDGIFGEDFPVSNDLSEPDREDQTEKLYSAKFPWSLKLAYSINYLNSNRQNEISSNSLMFSGDIELTPKWNVGISSGYDFKGNGFSYTQLRFGRDLDSWRMSFNWIPFGERQTYYFFIGIKSSMLSDLKYDQRQPRIF